MGVKVLFLAFSLQEEKELRQFSAVFLEFSKPPSWQGFKASRGRRVLAGWLCKHLWEGQGCVQGVSPSLVGKEGLTMAA